MASRRLKKKDIHPMIFNTRDLVQILQCPRRFFNVKPKSENQNEEEELLKKIIQNISPGRKTLSSIDIGRALGEEEIPVHKIVGITKSLRKYFRDKDEILELDKLWITYNSICLSSCISTVTLGPNNLVTAWIYSKNRQKDLSSSLIEFESYILNQRLTKPYQDVQICLYNLNSKSTASIVRAKKNIVKGFKVIKDSLYFLKFIEGCPNFPNPGSQCKDCNGCNDR